MTMASAGGMACPQCGGEESEVIETRTTREAIRRRRRCVGCGGRFTTYERAYYVGNLLHELDGVRHDLEALMRRVKALSL